MTPVRVASGRRADVGMCGLAVGQKVKVKGSSGPDAFRAHQLSGGGVDEDTCFEGPIQALAPDARRLRLLDRDLRVAEDAVIKNLLRDRVPLEGLSVGDMVTARGSYEPDVGFVVRKLKREQAFGFAIEVIRGRIEALDPAAMTLEIAGVLVRLSDDTEMRTG